MHPKFINCDIEVYGVLICRELPLAMILLAIAKYARYNAYRYNLLEP